MAQEAFLRVHLPAKHQNLAAPTSLRFGSRARTRHSIRAPQAFSSPSQSKTIAKEHFFELIEGVLFI